MLNVSSFLPGNPLVTVPVQQDAAGDIALLLIQQGRSFYYEPMPNEEGVFQVDPEHAPALKALATASSHSRFKRLAIQTKR